MPPTYLLAPGETLQATCIDAATAGQQVAVFARLRNLRTKNLFDWSQTFTLTGDRVQQAVTQSFIAQDTYEILAAGARQVVGGQKRGQVFVQLLIGGGANGYALLQDYVYAGHVPQLGSVVDPGPGGGEGNIRTVQIADPAAGTELIATVPTNALWRVHTFVAPILGGAVAFDARFAFTDGTNEKWLSSLVTVTATANETIIAAIGTTHNETAVTSTVPFPGLNLLPEGYVVRTDGITADDDYGVGELIVEEWLVL